MRFEEFAAARLGPMLTYAYLLCGDRELAKDLVQEVLARAMVRWRKVSAADHPDAYVRKMITNEFLSLRRRRQVRTVALSGHDPQVADASARLAERDELWQRMVGLPRQQRAVLVLRYYESLTDPEIAEVLGCRPATVRAYATRALAALRIELTEPRLAGKGLSS